jgi:hypothetical protein
MDPNVVLETKLLVLLPEVVATVWDIVLLKFWIYQLTLVLLSQKYNLVFNHILQSLSSDLLYGQLNDDVDLVLEAGLEDANWREDLSKTRSELFHGFLQPPSVEISWGEDKNEENAGSQEYRAEKGQEKGVEK